MPESMLDDIDVDRKTYSAHALAATLKGKVDERNFKTLEHQHVNTYSNGMFSMSRE